MDIVKNRTTFTKFGKPVTENPDLYRISKIKKKDEPGPDTYKEAEGYMKTSSVPKTIIFSIAKGKK